MKEVFAISLIHFPADIIILLFILLFFMFFIDYLFYIRITLSLSLSEGDIII